MESLEQPHDQENNATPEIKQGIQPAVQILKEAAAQFSTLQKEAEVLLRAKNPAGYTDRLKAKAQVLIDLPDLLASSLKGVEPETRQLVLDQVSYFATSARDALHDENGFALGVLLIPMGSATGDKNNLEKLIDSLENK